MTDHAPLLVIDDLVVRFAVRGGVWRRAVDEIRAVDGVSLHLERGRTLGIVGESGSGKSTLARAVLGLVRPTGGRVQISGRRLDALSPRRQRPLRRHLGVVFQAPGASMNPRQRIGAVVAEPLVVHREGSRGQRRRRVLDLLERCGLPPDAAGRYPHQLSGGQQQRVAIARALALRPRLIVLDEPTSSLDVSVQAQILNLLRDLQDAHGLAYLFISHDMAVIGHMCDRIAVMRAGRIVEEGDRSALLNAPSEAYTRELLAAVPAGPASARGERDASAAATPPAAAIE
jgi:ABC-type microcin C transport system duplicated ATPase subunit YejF